MVGGLDDGLWAVMEMGRGEWSSGRTGTKK